jgi:hypothetical protein
MNAGKLLILSRQLVARSDLRQSTPHHLLIGFASSTDIADLQHQGRWAISIDPSNEPTPSIFLELTRTLNPSQLPPMIRQASGTCRKVPGTHSS